MLNLLIEGNYCFIIPYIEYEIIPTKICSEISLRRKSRLIQVNKPEY